MEIIYLNFYSSKIVIFDNLSIEEYKEVDIFLLLVSADYISSDFINTREFNAILNKNNVIIPILSRQCYWESLPIAQFQATPEKWLSSYENIDLAWAEVVKNINRAIEKTLDRRNENYLPEETSITTKEGMDNKTSHLPHDQVTITIFSSHSEKHNRFISSLSKTPFLQVFSYKTIEEVFENYKSKKSNIFMIFEDEYSEIVYSFLKNTNILIIREKSFQETNEDHDKVIYEYDTENKIYGSLGSPVVRLLFAKKTEHEIH